MNQTISRSSTKSYSCSCHLLILPKSQSPRPLCPCRGGGAVPGCYGDWWVLLSMARTYQKDFKWLPYLHEGKALLRYLPTQKPAWLIRRIILIKYSLYHLPIYGRDEFFSLKSEAILLDAVVGDTPHVHMYIYVKLRVHRKVMITAWFWPVVKRLD